MFGEFFSIKKGSCSTSCKSNRVALSREASPRLSYLRRTQYPCRHVHLVDVRVPLYAPVFFPSLANALTWMGVEKVADYIGGAFIFLFFWLWLIFENNLVWKFL